MSAHPAILNLWCLLRQEVDQTIRPHRASISAQFRPAGPPPIYHHVIAFHDLLAHRESFGTDGFLRSFEPLEEQHVGARVSAGAAGDRLGKRRSASTPLWKGFRPSPHHEVGGRGLGCAEANYGYGLRTHARTSRSDDGAGGRPASAACSRVATIRRLIGLPSGPGARREQPRQILRWLEVGHSCRAMAPLLGPACLARPRDKAGRTERACTGGNHERKESH